MATSFETILKTENLAEVIPEKELENIGLRAVEGFERDESSRSGWLTKMNQAFDLALQVVERKTTPWDGASNVKFPLITIAAMQFNARAYPALIQDTNVVKSRTFGAPSEEKTQRAARVQRHMSYQVLEENEDWEEEMDRLLISLPIVGCSFKKTYFDPNKKRNCSDHILARDLVVDYYSKSLDGCQRITHRYYLRKHKVTERRRSGYYLDIDLGVAERFTNESQDTADKATGATPNTHDEPPREILEQHTFLDLDGDGYEEPYIVTIDRTSKKVVRLIKGFQFEDVEYSPKNGKVAKIEQTQYFTKYEFIPSPDGGFYGLGFGALMGPLNHTVDTLINQLIDAGTLSNMQGGFLGRGIKIRKGEHKRKPFEWTPVNMTGDDIRKNVFPLPVRDPSQTLFQLLGLLIEYTERISSVSDIMAGQNPGQNQPATTSMAVLEQGMKVFSGIFKRTHRGMRDEFRKLYRMNQIYLNPESEYEFQDEVLQIFQADYTDPYEIKPASDPSMITDTQQALQAEALVARAYSVPGYNTREAEMRWLQAMKVEDIEQVYPDPNGENAIPEKPSLEMLKLKTEQDKAKSDVLVAFGNMSIEAAKADAQIAQMKANSIALLAKAESEEAGIQMDQYKLELEDLKDARQNLQTAMEKMIEQSGMAGVENAPAN